MKKIIAGVVSLIATLSLSAQAPDAGVWMPVKENTIRLTGKRQIVPQKYLTLNADADALKTKLFAAPAEKNVRINASACVLVLPLPNGSFQRFRVVNSPVMAEELAAAFPDIQTFSIKGIDDPYASGKLDWNGFGFHAMVMSPEGDFFIDPYCLGNTGDYISYYTTDFVKDASQVLPEVGVVTDEDTKQQRRPAAQSEVKGNAKTAAATCVGGNLRTYRLAIACTGEYAVAATGQPAPTVAQTLAKIVTSINRVDGVYEREVSVRLVLIPTETVIVYTTASTDPFTGNNNANTLISQSQTVITTNIGSQNFDIGHTFSTGGGGLAYLGCVCVTSNKARGITGSPNPVGDPYDIDYVAHEMGHQFGGNHTFNSNSGSCNGNRYSATAAEPGSGITIMGYAGICGSTDNLGSNSIPYFHAVSYDEIVNFTNNGSGNNCAVTTTTGNQPPFVVNSGGYIVPVSTPFYLTGTAIDPDGDAVTYSWEETDAGISSGAWNSGNRPFFMSYAPSTSPTRYFPKQSVVATGNYTTTKGEYLPKTGQTLNFRLTARDNKMGGGGVCFSNISVVVDNSGPLMVTYPSNTGIVWSSGSAQTITWDVNGTDLSPIGCDSVRILISYNSGNTYTTLIGSTANDGVQALSAPTVTSTIGTCRIKVEAKANVFYDISNNNFTITNDPTIGFAEISQNNAIGLSVWPNPSNGEFHISAANLNSGAETQVEVLDLLGKQVYKSTYSQRSSLKETIDLSGLAKGFYVVKVSNSSNQAVYRVMKQ